MGLEHEHGNASSNTNNSSRGDGSSSASSSITNNVPNTAFNSIPYMTGGGGVGSGGIRSSSSGMMNNPMDSNMLMNMNRGGSGFPLSNGNNMQQQQMYEQGNHHYHPQRQRSGGGFHDHSSSSNSGYNMAHSQIMNGGSMSSGNYAPGSNGISSSGPSTSSSPSRNEQHQFFNQQASHHGGPRYSQNSHSMSSQNDHSNGTFPYRTRGPTGGVGGHHHQQQQQQQLRHQSYPGGYGAMNMYNNNTFNRGGGGGGEEFHPQDVMMNNHGHFQSGGGGRSTGATTLGVSSSSSSSSQHHHHAYRNNNGNPNRSNWNNNTSNMNYGWGGAAGPQQQQQQAPYGQQSNDIHNSNESSSSQSNNNTTPATAQGPLSTTTSSTSSASSTPSSSNSSSPEKNKNKDRSESVLQEQNPNIPKDSTTETTTNTKNEDKIKSSSSSATTSTIETKQDKDNTTSSNNNDSSPTSDTTVSVQQQQTPTPSQTQQQQQTHQNQQRQMPQNVEIQLSRNPSNLSLQNRNNHTPSPTNLPSSQQQPQNSQQGNNNNSNNNNSSSSYALSGAGCTCKKSRCLKLYCQCFASSILCNDEKCKCTSCENCPGKEKEIAAARAVILERNPSAFEDKFKSEGVMMPSFKQQQYQQQQQQQQHQQNIGFGNRGMTSYRGTNGNSNMSGSNSGVPPWVRKDCDDYGYSTMSSSQGYDGNSGGSFREKIGAHIQNNIHSQHQGSNMRQSTSWEDSQSRSGQFFGGGGDSMRNNNNNGNFHPHAGIHRPLPSQHSMQGGPQNHYNNFSQQQQQQQHQQQESYRSSSDESYRNMHMLQNNTGHSSLQNHQQSFQSNSSFQQHHSSDDNMRSDNNDNISPTSQVKQTHKLGCKCRRSFCLKKYCECFHHGVKCGSNCRCINCQNKEVGDGDKEQGSMSAEERVSQQMTASEIMANMKNSNYQNFRSSTPPPVGGMQGMEPANLNSNLYSRMNQNNNMHPTLNSGVDTALPASNVGHQRNEYHDYPVGNNSNSTLQNGFRRDSEGNGNNRRDSNSSSIVQSQNSINENSKPTDQFTDNNSSSLPDDYTSRENLEVIRKAEKQGEDRMTIMAALAMTELFGKSTSEMKATPKNETRTDSPMPTNEGPRPVSNTPETAMSGKKVDVKSEDSGIFEIDQINRKRNLSNEDFSLKASESSPTLIEGDSRDSKRPRTCSPPVITKGRSSSDGESIQSSSDIVPVVSSSSTLSSGSPTESKSHDPSSHQSVSSSHVPSFASRPPGNQGFFNQQNNIYPHSSYHQQSERSYMMHQKAMARDNMSTHQMQYAYNDPSQPQNLNSTIPQQQTSVHLMNNADSNYNNDNAMVPSSAGPMRKRVVETKGGNGSTTPSNSGRTLPKSLSFRKICSKCGKTRGEHGELGFGNKCVYQDCGRCGAGLHMHLKAQTPMGFSCTLAVEDGATPGMSALYDKKIRDLAAMADLKKEVQAQQKKQSQ